MKTSISVVKGLVEKIQIDQQLGAVRDFIKQLETYREKRKKITISFIHVIIV